MVIAMLFLQASADLHAQAGKEASPAAALTSILLAACRQNMGEFEGYLTAENAEAYHKLPEEQRISIMRRLSLLEDPGRPITSTDAQSHTVVRCQGPGSTAEFRFGTERMRENLAFIPVQVVGGNSTEFGLVREGGGWRLLSLGLLLFDVPELEKRWMEQDLEAREAAAIKTLHALADVIETYRSAWGRLPEALEQLGPAPKEGASPEAADLVQADLAAGSRAGYIYRYRIIPADAGTESKFELVATPAEYGKTGRRSFLLDAEGNLRGADHRGAVATITDLILPSGHNE